MAKIAILTLNPGIDRVVYFDGTVELGGHNRSSRAVTSQGSKGANQAIMLKNLGIEPEYFAFTGGVFGRLSEGYTEEAGVRSHFVPTGCGVRLNLKLIEADGRGTELNESGGPVTETELNRLTDLLFESDFDLLSICGSLPRGIDPSAQNRLIARARSRGAAVVLDASGALLASGAAEKPRLIKPNRFELSAFGFEPPQTADDALGCCKSIYDKFGCEVFCTLDRDGAVYVGADGAYRVTVNPRRAVGFSGAGDAGLAAFICLKFCRNSTTADALRFATAASLAKITLPGTAMPTGEQLEAELPNCEVLG